MLSVLQNLSFVMYQGFTLDNDPPKVFVSYWREEQQSWEVVVSPGDMWDTLIPVWIQADGSLVSGQ